MNRLPTPAAPQIRLTPGDKGTGGFRVNLDEIAAANAMAPRLDVASFAAAAGAGAYIGKGLEDIGQGLDAITQEQFASINRRKVDEAGAKLTAANDEIAGMITAEKDETKWPGIFSREAAKWEGELLADRTLSPAARDAIATKISGWRITTESSVKRSAFNRTLQKESEGLEGQRIAAMHAGNFPEARRIIEEQQKRGLAGADTTAKQRAQTDDAEKEAKEKAQTTALYDEAAADPRAFLAKYKDRPQDMDVAIHARAINHAQEMDREAVAGDVDRLMQSVATGKITVPAEVDKFEPDNPRITAEMRDRMRVHVAAKSAATRRAFIAEHAAEFASAYRSRVKDFDFARDGELAYYNLRMGIDELPGPIAGEISGPLEAKFPGRTPKFQPAPEIRELIDDTLHGLLNRGAFGSFDNGTGKDKDGKPVAKPGESPEEVYKRDGPQYEKALAEKAKVGGKMRRWLEANPKATEAQAQAHLYELVADATRAGFLDQFDTPPPPGTYRPALYSQPPDDAGPMTLDGPLPTKEHTEPLGNILLPPHE